VQLSVRGIAVDETIKVPRLFSVLLINEFGCSPLSRSWSWTHGSWVGHIAFFFIFLKNIFTIYKPENGKKLSSEFLKCLEFFQRKIKVVNIYILGFDHERNTKTCLLIFSGSPQDIKPEAYKPHTFSSLSKSHLLWFICSL
jgi:hypothetical protein